MPDPTATIIDQLRKSPKLEADFQALCACGGRFAGSDSEARAHEFLTGRLRQFGDPQAHRVTYEGWSRRAATLERLSPTSANLSCESLVRSPPTPPEGLEAEVVDLGRGAPEDFERLGGELPGRIALVRHEDMFATGHIHRRRKRIWAEERGAVGFLIACHLPGDVLVTGSAYAEPGGALPAAGITAEAATALARTGEQWPRARLTIAVDRETRTAQNLILDMPGASDEWVVLSAHYDGHALAQSAIDNGSGAATVVNVAEALAPHMVGMRRGLRLCLFTVEEWGLQGSRDYVGEMSQAERDAIALNINLDSVAGSPNLTALTSEFPKLEAFLQSVAANADLDLGYYRPMMANSDHYNFARGGIPAFRLAAGFDEPDSRMRHVLTPGDTADKVAPEELTSAAIVTARIALAACTAESLDLRDDLPHPSTSSG
jgi:hypothetical protein